MLAKRLTKTWKGTFPKITNYNAHALHMYHTVATTVIPSVLYAVGWAAGRASGL